MALPAQFLKHLQTKGYHPRSDKHSNALGIAIVDDLVATCPLIKQRAAAGDIVFDLNFDLVYGTATWNVDVVLGPPPPGVADVGLPIIRSTPSTVQIAMELKAVMTEHHKAAKNRKRDLEAHHEHVHNYASDAIAAGVLLVNIAPQFRSPLRGGAITPHKNPTALVQHCMNEANAINMRGGRPDTDWMQRPFLSLTWTT